MDISNVILSPASSASSSQRYSHLCMLGKITVHPGLGLTGHPAAGQCEAGGQDRSGTAGEQAPSGDRRWSLQSHRVHLIVAPLLSMM